MMLAASLEFERTMRIASLEITGVLALVAILAARPRVRAAADVGALTPMQLTLEVRERAGPRAVRLHTPAELGRTGDAQVAVADPEVSRRHLRFESRSGRAYVEDLGSSNGTFLNGRRLTEPIEIRAGDEIDVGTTRIVVTSVEPA